ncbi:MAG: FAD-dependent oxidoreductase [Sumerlaeia bacterium]
MKTPSTAKQAKKKTTAPPKYDLIILGGGVCGLAAAYEYLGQNPNHQVLLLEKEERLGGLARSLTLGDQVADMGPHRLHTEIPEVREFLLQYAEKELKTVKRKSSMYLKGTWIDYPPKPLEILRVLGFAAIVKVFASYGRTFIRTLAGLEKSKPDHFEQVMCSAFGEELYQLIVLDYTQKVWKRNPKQIHGDIARVRVSAGGLQRMVKRVLVGEQKGQETALPEFLYLPGGVETLIKKLAADTQQRGLNVQCSTSVENLIQQNGSWRIDVQANNQQSHFSARQVLSTIPVTDLGRILLKSTPDATVENALKESKFIANFLILVLLKRPRLTQNQWLYFPGQETIFNRGYEPKNFSETMGSKDQCLVMFEITCYEGSSIWHASDEKLIRQTLKDCMKIDLFNAEDVAETSVFRIPHTYPLYDLEYRERMARVWKYLGSFPGLLSTGRQGLFLHNNMDHSIFMGFESARLLAKESQGDQCDSKPWYNRIREFQEFRIVD